MNALVCLEPGKFAYSEVKDLSPLPGRAIIKLKRIGICGTDLHAFEGTQPYFSYPRILGHELSGELVAIEENADYRLGDSVTLIPYFNCGVCIACRRGRPNCCTNISVFGVHEDGGMAEYISVPIDKLVKGDGLSLDELSLVEPLAIGAHGIARANVEQGEFVLVVGAGPIGMGTMEMARIAGARVIALDMNDMRLDFCTTKLQVPYVINGRTTDVVSALKEITGGDMPTVVIDATGNLAAINAGFSYVAHGGRYVLIGLQRGELVVSHPEFHKREATLMSSRNATRADFDFVITAMQQRLVSPSTYITHRVKFAEVKDQFASWLDPANGVIKAMVEVE